MTLPVTFARQADRVDQNVAFIGPAHNAWARIAGIAQCDRPIPAEGCA